MIADEPDFSGATWFKSSYSGGNNGQCVEVADLRVSVGVRDSKRRAVGPVLVFGPLEWAAFVGGVRRGEFDPS
jgi:hypothetical protein